MGGKKKEKKKVWKVINKEREKNVINQANYMKSNKCLIVCF